MTTLKYLRKKHGLTIRGLAAKVGMNQPYLTQAELRKSNIGITSLIKIADALGEPLDPLLVAYKIIPDYAIEALEKDSSEMERIIREAAKKIIESK